MPVSARLIRHLTSVLLTSVLLLNAGIAPADELSPISIIIDDMGYRLENGRKWINLPGPLAYAFLPEAPHTPALSRFASRQDKEILLHQPMEANRRHSLGPGGITTAMSRADISRIMTKNLSVLPLAAGVSNHMGSRLTRDLDSIDAVMRLLSNRGGLYFFDSRTTAHTLAHKLAKQHGIPSLKRDVFLDSDREIATIRMQFQRLIEKAHEQNGAVAIAHPYPETLQVLSEVLGDLATHNVRLVAPSQMIQYQEQRNPLWQLSLSHSPRAAKN